MFWNYRVMRHNIKDEVWYGIHEVYYNEQDKPNGWTKETVDLSEEDKHSLKEAVQNILLAFDKPTLNYDSETIAEELVND